MVNERCLHSRFRQGMGCMNWVARLAKNGDVVRPRILNLLQHSTQTLLALKNGHSGASIAGKCSTEAS